MCFIHCIATALAAPGRAWPAACSLPTSYSQIYAFGDRLSDVGILSRIAHLPEA